MVFSLIFDNNHSDHDDLVLQLAGHTWRADTYYLALDRKLLPDREDSEKVKAVLRRLLEQWLVAVEGVMDGGAVFLPYDFSDQYTGWLRCERLKDMVEVVRGWAKVEGWSFFPSDIGDYLTNLVGFQVDGPPVQTPVAEFLRAIRLSLAEAA